MSIIICSIIYNEYTTFIKNEIIRTMNFNKIVRRPSKLSKGQYKLAGKKLYLTPRLRVGNN